MPQVSAYSFKNVSATIDRREIIAPWDGDDAIVVAQGTDAGTGLVGADGSSIFSVSTDASATITIRLMHTSPTHRLLHERWKAQKARGGATRPFSFAMKDRVSGEGGAASNCFIQGAPSDQKGKNAAVREWVLWTGEWTPEIPNG